MSLKDSINNLDEEGFSLLHLKAKAENAEIVQKLIEAGADIEMKDRKHGSTALLWACQNGHTIVVKILLHNDANAIEMSYIGTSAIHFAAESESSQTVQMLIEKGVKIEFIDKKNGLTPLLWDSIYSYISFIDFIKQTANNMMIDMRF